MSADEYDPFKGESGFKDDFDGTVQDAWFATPEYDNANLTAYLKVMATDGEEVELRYGCGPDWGTFDGGETTEHPKGATKGFNNKTKYFGLISAAMGLEGVEKVLRERSAAGGGSGPKRADLWKGLSFHWNVFTETIKMKDRETGEMIERDVTTVLPTAFLGVGKTDGAASSSAGASPAGSTTSSPAADSSATNGSGIDDATMIRLKGLAKQAKGHPDFADAVMEQEDLLSNADVMTAVAQEAFYKELVG